MAYTPGYSRATTGAFIDVKLDERALARAEKRISQYEGRAFRERMDRVYRAGAQLLVSPIRRAIDTEIAGHGKNPGMLRQRVSVRKGRPPMGYLVRYGTKSRAPHSHLVARGHRIVTPGGKPTGGRSVGRPIYDEVIAAYQGKVIDFISRNTAKDEVRASAFVAAIRSF